MHVQQEEDKNTYEMKNLLTAKFIMVTISPNKKSNVLNIPLNVKTDIEKQNFEAGKRMSKFFLCIIIYILIIYYIRSQLAL